MHATLVNYVPQPEHLREFQVAESSACLQHKALSLIDFRS